jgi:DNA-directed RNA polymerase subunit alpha
MKVRLACPNCGTLLALLEIEGLRDDPPPVPIEVWRLTPIGKMNLSVRSETALENGGFKTAADLDAASDTQLLRTTNFGRKGLAEVREALARMAKGEGL